MTARCSPVLRSLLAVTLAGGLALLGTAVTAQTVDSTDDAFAVSQGGDVPPYVVPVLRLVSKTHVEPTTGLVLSDSGLVLVPAGFASPDDEIIVLDGGTDIVSNGRKARIERNYPMDGLQVLNVYGLRRSPAPFAESGPSDGDPLRLAAFPPAEQIAEGAAPLDVPTTVTVFGESGKPAVSGDSPLPNVTGPLLDRCGNVVAFSTASGVQSMESSPGTRYRWRDTLLSIFERLGARPGPSACIAETPSAESEPQLEPETGAEPEAPEEANGETAEISGPDAPIEPAAEEVADQAKEPEDQNPPDDELPELEILPPIEDVQDEPSPVADDVPEQKPRGAWPWLLLGAALLVAGLLVHGWRRRMSRSDEPDASASQATADEASTERGASGPASSTDSRLLLEGRLADGRPLSLSCPVNRDAINVVIGRGQADLRIESAAVSRRHAALNGTADALTLTDLGSSNGTTVNGVPCMEGEILYVEPGDTLVLGDARFMLELAPDEGAEQE